MSYKCTFLRVAIVIILAAVAAQLAAAAMATAIDVGGCDDGNGDDKCVCDLVSVILAMVVSTFYFARS